MSWKWQIVLKGSKRAEIKQNGGTKKTDKARVDREWSRLGKELLCMVVCLKFLLIKCY